MTLSHNSSDQARKTASPRGSLFLCGGLLAAFLIGCGNKENTASRQNPGQGSAPQLSQDEVEMDEGTVRGGAPDGPEGRGPDAGRDMRSFGFQGGDGRPDAGPGAPKENRNADGSADDERYENLTPARQGPGKGNYPLYREP